MTEEIEEATFATCSADYVFSRPEDEVLEIRLYASQSQADQMDKPLASFSFSGIADLSTEETTEAEECGLSSEPCVSAYYDGQALEGTVSFAKLFVKAKGDDNPKSMFWFDATVDLGAPKTGKPLRGRIVVRAVGGAGQ